MIFRLNLHPLWSLRSAPDLVPNDPPAESPHTGLGGGGDFISYLAPEPLGGVPEELEKVEMTDPDHDQIS